MKRHVIVSMLLLLSVLLFANPSEAKIFPYAYENNVLPNGFKSILVPMKGSGLVAYYTIVRTGSRDEWEPGKSGFAHFFEHMMFRGTENYSADEYEHMITEMGADNNAYTTDDYTCYTLVVSSDNLENAMMLDAVERISLDGMAGRTPSKAIGKLVSVIRSGNVSFFTAVQCV